MDAATETENVGTAQQGPRTDATDIGDNVAADVAMRDRPGRIADGGGFIGVGHSVRPVSEALLGALAALIKHTPLTFG